MELPSFRAIRDAAIMLEKRKCENMKKKTWRTIVLLWFFFVM